tara:strand:+ start:211 stop:831 length:621 start_codon:yes stop_codon:yes gene_type:complete
VTVRFHKGDLSAEVIFNDAVAIDTETMGLNNFRDKLCLVQLSAGDGNAHIVQLDRNTYDAPNLKKLLEDNTVEKIFHFARFDIAVIKHYLGVNVTPIYCTKIASKLVRTYSDSHSLKNLCEEMLNKKISKQQQSSDWGREQLSEQQLNYAASDVLYLHKLKNILEEMLVREGRQEIAQQCFSFLPVRAELDLAGWGDHDIFSHESK